ncbi:uncharacterized protein ASPGLDRAFT_60433 [Aspergillus glaucus CBS 516.65]|uniref:RNase H type-1 domain-containing protein n=1 Tax=Aspergillus glaucus CBS 516.65 TaxID=1160497 RepID=A0A1L9VB04_ASPGL|nr:hypothetical protein ASPGLDRAFT_60433 [Aspergillus glaucus CBS 516.65]OJJ81116.1 hypothetical protein ASPGLDRAFT_60433 [Aspergillus glaucus CBS 516.65]
MSLHCTCRSPKESDGSRLENGRRGAEIAWQEPGGAWKTRRFPLGKGYEVFDAELLGVVQALQVAQKAGDQRPVTILLDSQAAIARLQHTQSGPGQALVTQAHTIQPAKTGSREISLAFAGRARTEAIAAQKQRWPARKLGQQSQQGRRTYRPQRNWRLDPSAAVAPKHLASRYFQLKSGHAAIGTYLHWIQAQEDATCQGCGSSRETVHHLLFECRQWQHQRNRLYKDLEADGVMRPTIAEEHPQGRLLGEPRATRALLQSLANTSIGLPQGHLQRAAERAWKDEEWGLEALEEASRTGEG